MRSPNWLIRSICQKIKSTNGSGTPKRKLMRTRRRIMLRLLPHRRVRMVSAQPSLLIRSSRLSRSISSMQSGKLNLRKSLILWVLTLTNWPSKSSQSPALKARDRSLSKRSLATSHSPASAPTCSNQTRRH